MQDHFWDMLKDAVFNEPEVLLKLMKERDGSRGEAGECRGGKKAL